MSLILPACRHRGMECGNDRWACHSPKLVIPGGLVSASDCMNVCPFVDHENGAGDAPRGHEAPLADDSPARRARPGASSARVSVSRTRDDDLALAVITAPRVVATLERTVRELRRAGFSQTIRVFAEPGSSVTTFPGVIVRSNPTTLGAWRNWLRAAGSLLEETTASYFLICEDDISLARCARLALDHAIRTRPGADWGYASLYTAIQHLGAVAEGEGWRPIALGERDYWGALAYCFTRDSLEDVLRDDGVLGHRGDRDADVIVSRALRRAGKRLEFHLPSLADHIGRGISSLGHAPLSGSRAAGFSADYDGYVAEESGAVEAPARLAEDLEVRDRGVTVVVATYNCAAYLADCLRSLRGQSVPCSIVVVDDGSRDDTRNVLGTFAESILLLRHEENRGSRAARRTGLSAARTEWVVMADADASYQPDFLESLLAAADPRTTVVSCSWSRQVAETAEAEVARSRPFLAEALWWDNTISMSSLVRRSAISESVGSSDDLDDWSLWLDLAARGGRFRAVDRVLFRAHERPEGKSATLRRDPARYRREVARLRRTHAALIGLEGRIPVVLPAKDCFDLTERCLLHLAWYSGLPIEVFYVDNGSRPDVPERVAALAESLDLPLATIRNSSNRQFTQSVNQGLRFAGARHVLCLNNDCFVGPDCLERLYWHLTRTTGRVAAVGPLTGDDEGQSIRHPARRAQAGIAPHHAIDYADPLAGAAVVHGSFRAVPEPMVAFFCTLLHRDALRECGLLDDVTREFEAGLGADDEWCLRTASRGWTSLVALDAYAVHLGHQSFRRLEIDRDALQGPARATFEKRIASIRGN